MGRLRDRWRIVRDFLIQEPPSLPTSVPPPHDAPPKWKLSDVAPELEASVEYARFAAQAYQKEPSPDNEKQLASAFAKLGESYDAKCDDFIHIAQEIGQKLAAQQDAPDAKAIHSLYSDNKDLLTHFNRTENILHLLESEFYYAPGAVETVQQARGKKAAVSHEFSHIWRNINLDAKTIEVLGAQDPDNITDAIKALLAPSPPSQPFVSPTERRKVDEAVDPRLAHYWEDYNTLMTSPPASSIEQGALASKILNAKLYQQGKAAMARGTSPSAAYEADQSLPSGFVDGYFKALPEMLDNALPNRLYWPLQTAARQTPQKYSWEEAQALVVSAFSRFHPDMGEIAKMAFTDGWISADNNPHKQGGAATAYASGVSHPANHPYVSMKFDGSANSLIALSHELGHAVAIYLENDVQYLADGRTIQPQGRPAVDINRSGEHIPLPDAAPEFTPPAEPTPKTDALQETFAHFAEELVMEEAARRAPDPSRYQNLLATQLNGLHNSLAQTALGHIENALYKTSAAQNLEPLSTRQIADVVRQSDKEFGYSQPLPARTAKRQAQLDAAAAVRVASKIHIVQYSPHYLMSYPLAEMAGAALLKENNRLSRAQRKEFAGRWMDIMRNTSAYTYGSAMQEMGIETGSLEKLAAPLIEKMEVLRQSLHLDNAYPPPKSHTQTLQEERAKATQGRGRY